ncbi:MAG: hypothetical protein M1477_05745 [Candidatus Thermoplasmatota archaeon]|nr:hypothetical protein [Candidatus Thermoplasmatota archaeon]
MRSILRNEDARQQYKENYVKFSEDNVYALAETGKDSTWISATRIYFDTETYRFDLSQYKTVREAITDINRYTTLSKDETEAIKHLYAKHKGQKGNRSTEIQFMAYWALTVKGKTYSGNTALYLTKTIKRLLQKYKAVCLIGHNLKFDMTATRINNSNLFEYLINKGISFISTDKKHHNIELKANDNSKILADDVFYVEITSNNKQRKNTYKLYLMDSFNFLRKSLHDLEDDYSFKKFFNEDEYKSAPKKWNEIIKRIYDSSEKDDILKQYYTDKKQYEGKPLGQLLCETDTIALERIFENLLISLKQHNAIIGITTAGTAMRTFVKNYLDRDIVMPKQLMADLQAAYKGGNVQVFAPTVYNSKKYADHRDVIVADANSLYPSVMVKYKQPVEYIRTITGNIDEAEIENMIASGEYRLLIRCKWHTPLKEFEAFREDDPEQFKHLLITPIARTRKGKLEYLYDSTQEEIVSDREYMLQKNITHSIFDISAVYVFRADYIFKEYVDYWYNLKKNAKNPADRATAKLMNNSLYGRWQLHTGHPKIMRYSERDPPTYKIYRERSKFSLAKTTEYVNGERRELTFYQNYYTISTRDNFESVAVIGTFITADARCDLFKAMLSVNPIYINYIDTDSMHLPRQRVNELNFMGWNISKDNDEIGKFKIEKQADNEFIRTLKVYELYNDNGEIVSDIHKGVRKNAEKLDENTFRNYEFHTIKGKSGFVEVDYYNKDAAKDADKLDFVETEIGVRGYPRGFVDRMKKLGIDPIALTEKIIAKAEYLTNEENIFLMVSPA